MSFQEPVNIMGVIAFPNENGNRDIRFIDASYHTLFTLPDGGNLVLTYLDGETSVLPCRYIDDCHTQVGAMAYHICEFAERMEHNGTIYAPEHPKETDTYGSYEVYQIKEVSEADYIFRCYEFAKARIDPAHYQKVYAGVWAAGVTLDDLWEKHNRDSRPFGRKMRSMSVSDIVVLHRGKERRAYYVDSIGFQETPEFFKTGRKGAKKRTETAQ
jgi:hypothetical protein